MMFLELQDKKFDVISFVESIVAFGGITLGIGNISSFGLISIEGGLPLVVGAIVCVFFMGRQCTLEKPFLDVKILANWKYAVSVIASMVLYLVMMGSSVMMPLYVQSVMGYSAVCFRSCYTAGISCDGDRQPVCRKSVRPDRDQKDFRGRIGGSGDQ